MKWLALVESKETPTYGLKYDLKNMHKCERRCKNMVKTYFGDEKCGGQTDFIRKSNNQLDSLVCTSCDGHLAGEFKLMNFCANEKITTLQIVKNVDGKMAQQNLPKCNNFKFEFSIPQETKTCAEDQKLYAYNKRQNLAGDW